MFEYILGTEDGLVKSRVYEDQSISYGCGWAGGGCLVLDSWAGGVVLDLSLRPDTENLFSATSSSRNIYNTINSTFYMSLDSL